MSAGGEINPAEVKIDQPKDQLEEINPSEIKLDSEPHIDASEVKIDGQEESPTSKYSTLEQQIKTGLEGAAQGFAGPLATYVETKFFGADPKDIKGRAEENPLIHGTAEAATLGVGLLTGIGEAGLIAKGAGAIAEAANLSKIGRLALKGMIEGASFTASDEITKAMLNQPGSDPETPASAALLYIGAGGLVGGLSGGIFGLGEGIIGKGLDKLNDSKMVSKIEGFLAKLGESKDPLGDLGVTKKISGAISKSVAWPLAVKTGTGQIGYEAIQEALSKPINKIIGKANPYVTDAVIKSILTNEASGIPNAVHYATQIAKGAQKATRGVDLLFKTGGSQLATPASESAKNLMNEFIEGGQIDTQMQNSMNPETSGYADGGMISEPNNKFSNIFPEQNTLLNATKGRVSTYLNSVRPLPNQPKLAFDTASPQTDKKRSYEKALNFAVSPLSILDHVNKGDLTAEHMQHFTSLYPDIHRYLSTEMTKRITKAQLKGEKPPYKKRQAMSLFLGADLDSTFSPAAISTIQGMYATQKAKQQPQAKGNKKGNGAISKSSNSYLTDEQAREKRMQNQKA